MSENDKSAYDEAMNRCPQLVETESDPFHFWKFCNSDIWSAGKKLCKYWQFRKKVFGPDKAFLPLDLTGHGAMDRDDIKLLQSGWMSLLPPWKSKTQPVVFADRRKLLPTCTLDQKLRVVLYLTKECCINHPTISTEGVHYLFMLAMPKMNKNEFDHEFSRVLSIFVYEALPAKIHAKVILDLPKRRAKDDGNFSVQNILSKYLKSTLDAGGKMRDFEFLYEHKKGDILDKLIAQGASKEGLPESVGGCWKYSEMIDWCTEKMKVDRQKGRNKRLPSMSVDERKAARRASNAIHSRRKREKRKAEVERLQAEGKRLKLENESLQVEGDRLQHLSQQAMFYVNQQVFQNATSFTVNPSYGSTVGHQTSFPDQRSLLAHRSVHFREDGNGLYFGNNGINSATVSSSIVYNAEHRPATLSNMNGVSMHQSGTGSVIETVVQYGDRRYPETLTMSSSLSNVGGMSHAHLQFPSVNTNARIANRSRDQEQFDDMSPIPFAP